MKPDPELPEKFAITVLEELALLRAEMISQRSLLIELLSRISHERRRKIKDRLYDKRTSAAFKIAPPLRTQVGLKRRGALSRGRAADEVKGRGSPEAIRSAAADWQKQYGTGASISARDAWIAGARYIGGWSEQSIAEAFAHSTMPEGANAIEVFVAGATWALRGY